MVSVIFGKSSILIDWCPQCHGMWLDRGEFEAITDYLKHELMQHAPEGYRKTGRRGCEARLERRTGKRGLKNLLDARAAVSALINATIFEHPALFNLCSGIARLPVR